MADVTHSKRLVLSFAVLTPVGCAGAPVSPESGQLDALLAAT